MLFRSLAVRDLHAPSIETVSRIAGETCGLQHMQADEAAQLRHALRALLYQGFTFEIARIAGKVGEGALDGRLVFRWLPTPVDQTQLLPLAQLMQTSARLRLTGQALDADAAFDLGLITSKPDDIDWADEIRIAIEERVAMSPDALTGLEANLRFNGPENMVRSEEHTSELQSH